ncbi:NAD-dependent epimerase/dehydratase family protein [Methylobacterium soli]|uniref:NAD-dependent epimerase/dehydratase family protein n=1 Tax=Methylobacterium soli TaxID=553447 RepID=A0A6L3T6G5_9HYPH|nr:NAD-dependent epimerase/dehydratase family protein [Methylobacterium soli]KAB1080965.1 NAD-dependent epimerase/dehydratase family protein [Methylobacterium soli]GJE41168.1 CDP-paratose 2-epimerase [Methylobacterium soli]
MSRSRPLPPGGPGGRNVLITGGAGFIGANLADHLAAAGHGVTVYDALMRPGVEANLAWLEARHRDRLTAVIGDIRDADRLAACVARADVVFHFAAQVAVTTSLVTPLEDFAINLGGTLTLLEALRARRVPLIFASTNKVYGNLTDLPLTATNDAYLPADPALRRWGISEARPLDFHTPYGCSKGGADQYVLDYARSFGIPTAVMRMSCIYGPRQIGTEDQGWVAHFLISALAGRPISIFGDGMQVRDILHVSDAVTAYVAAWTRIEAIAGQAFNLGGGPDNAVSLHQVLAYIERLVGRPIDRHFSDWRAGDQRYYVSDTRRAASILGLPAPMPWRRGVAELAASLAQPQLGPGALLSGAENPVPPLMGAAE